MSLRIAGLLLLFLTLFYLSAGAADARLEALLQSIIEEKTIVPDVYQVINLGNFFRTKLYKPAQDEFTTALQLDPANKIALINLSYTF